jgi:superfamily II DNA or RNA helicase
MFNHKELTDKELEYILAMQKFKIPPRRHQQISLAFAADTPNNRVMYFQGVGSGKTLCALFTAQLWGCKRILVICPGAALSAWDRDIPLGTDYSYTFLLGSKKERTAELMKEKNVSIVNYEGLKCIYATLKPVGYDDTGKVVREWVINRKLISKYKFDCIIIDEAHRVNNYKSLQSKLLLKLSKNARCVVGMTGTSVDKSMLELFNIYKVIDLGATLGTSFLMYRGAYFVPDGYDWVLKKGAKNKILKRISASTISFESDECIDLPELQELPISVHPSKEFLKLQHQVILHKPVIVKGEELDTGDRANSLRELAGGFIYHGDKKAYRLKSNPKLDALKELIQDNSCKLVVFYWYKEERKLIETMLMKNKIRFVSMCAGLDFAAKKAVEKVFNTTDAKVMVAQSKISEGYDACVAKIGVFYLPLGSPRMRTQCIGRFYRSGQEQNCIAYDLILENSVDNHILEDRSERFSLVNSVKRYMQGYLDEEESSEV